MTRERVCEARVPRSDTNDSHKTTSCAPVHVCSGAMLPKPTVEKVCVEIQSIAAKENGSVSR